MKSLLLVGALLPSLASLCLAQSVSLSEYTATYQANANGLAASAERTLEPTGENSYRLTNTLQASLAGQTLASLEQSSDFLLEDGRLLPQAYSYQLGGVSRESHAIAYNWDAGIAISTENGDSRRLLLSDGVQDQLSYQTALRLALNENSAAGDTLSFQIIDGDEVDTHEYRIGGREMLSTPLGELHTVKLERVREASDERVTEIWLAVDWEFLLARLEQVNRSGLHIVLELKSAELSGESVTGRN